MKFYFCEGCGRRVTETDISSGAGKDKKLKGIYCKACAIGVSTMDSLPLTDEDAKKLLAATPANGNPTHRPQPKSTRKSGILRTGKSSQRLRTAQGSRTGSASGREERANCPPSSLLGPSNLILLSGASVVGVVLLLLLFGSSPNESATQLSKKEQFRNTPTPAAVAVKLPDQGNARSIEAREKEPSSAPLSPLERHPLPADAKSPEPVEKKKAAPADTLAVEPDLSIDPLPQTTPAKPEKPDLEKKDLALEKAQAALALHLQSLEEAALNKDPTAAVEIANSVRDDPDLKLLETDRQALVDVAMTLQRVETKRLETLSALKDGKRHSFSTPKRTITGVVSKISEDGLDVRVEGKINGKIIEYGKHIKFSDLTPKGKVLVFGRFEPKAPDEWCLQALYRLAHRALEEVPPALTAAGTHPLRTHLNARLAVLTAARRNQEAQQYWKTHLARRLTEKLTLADLSKAQEALATFATRFAETSFFKSTAADRTRLEASLREVDSLLAHWKFEETPSTKLLQDASGRGHHGKAQQGTAKASPEVAPGLPGDQGSVVIGSKARVAVGPILLGTEHTIDIWLKFQSNGTVMGTWMNAIFKFDPGSIEYGWGYMNKVRFKMKMEKDKWYHFLMVRKEKKVSLDCNEKRIGTGTLKENNPQKHSLFGYTSSCQISDVRIYGRAFSEEEVAKAFSQGTAEQGTP